MVGASNTVLSRQSSLNLSFNKLGKRKRLVECKTNCHSSLRKPILRNYTNFSKSGLPRRLLYYHDGQWMDYPQDIVELVREHFQLKNSAIEVNFDGCHLLLDTLYMIQLELKTGLQKNIAWIDESGCPFFPELYSTNNEIHECYESELEDDPTVVVSEPNDTCEIKLQLEIDLNGVCNSKLDEDVEESNIHAKKPKIEEKPASHHMVLEIGDSCNQKSDAKTKGASAGRTKDFSMHEIVDADTVRNMFLMGMSSIINADILDIKRCSGPFLQTRLGLFQKQVELTKKNRGDPNVQYAWMAATKDALSSIMKYGLGHVGPRIRSSYGTGIGVHLTSLNSASLSASYCDDDDNGVRYFVLCRVILGNVEVVKPGQWHPSSENFDSGVDNLRNPCHYIVWNMNMNTHIFPEYVISFKTSSGAEGVVVGKESRIGVSGIINNQGPQGQLQLDCSPVESSSQKKAISPGSNSQKAPKTPWMPFPMLLEAISKEVAPKEMKLVNVDYDLFRHKKLSRDDFIKKLRSIAGDALLRSTIMNLQCKLQRRSTCTLKRPKQEQEC